MCFLNKVCALYFVLVSFK